MKTAPPSNRKLQSARVARATREAERRTRLLARALGHDPRLLLPVPAGESPAGSGGSPAPPNQKGVAFTLIELLLAISIMSLILAAMSGILFIAFHLQSGVTDALEESIPVEHALTFIQRDLSSIVCNNASNNIMLIGSFQTINQTNVLPGQIGPDFYTTGGEPDGLVPWGDIEKIDYLLSPSTNRTLAGRDLVRAVTRNLLPVISPTVPDQKTVLLSGVDNVIFYYYDGVSWDQNWDSTQQTNLPYGIKMQIIMAAQGRTRMATAPMIYELYIPVDVQMTTNPTIALP
jgi:type II secretion system protein J